MLIVTICFFIFLFAVYQIAKDDFIFLRKNITLDEIFNTIFIALPVGLLVARLVFIFIHPNTRYLNPLVFLAVPYFPGLSLAGGIVGVWICVTLFMSRKKMPAGRILDMLGVAFLLSLSIGIFLQAILSYFTNRLLGVEEIGRSMLGIAFFIFCLSQFLKNNWQEGSIVYLATLLYTILAFMSVGFMILSHKSISMSQLIVTLILFGLSLFLFLFKTNPLGKLVRK